MEEVQPLTIVLGPTGSGKSELALAIAERFRGEIVNCDSLQLYRMFDIGTAKVTASERRGIPHHLFDAFNPVHVCTAGEYVRLARPILQEITDRGNLPVVAGGTGFFSGTIRSVIPRLQHSDTRTRRDRRRNRAGRPVVQDRTLVAWRRLS